MEKANTRIKKYNHTRSLQDAVPSVHGQGGNRLPVFSRLSLEVAAGEGGALYGPSGSGKSTLLRSLYANYKPGSGHVWVRHADDSGSDWVDRKSTRLNSSH